MPSPVSVSLLDVEANNLLANFLSHYIPSSGFGHMSSTIYNTAWVSMITKDNDWLFPVAFQYLLDRQNSSGGWESSSDTDSILNTLSALLSMQLHSHSDVALFDRIHKAKLYLVAWLKCWNIATVERVGFEITVSTLLSLLSQQGIEFSFPQPIENSAHRRYMSTEHRSSTRPKVLLALQMRWKFHGLPQFNSRVPNIVCNLHDGGFKFTDLDQPPVSQISVLLEEGIEAGNAPGVGEDADDSAKVLTVLHYLGINKPVAPLCDAFEVESHFQCYPYERNASIAVQCNVLSALEATALRPITNGVGPTAFTEERLFKSILKTVGFISEAWWTTNSEMLDKWHDSPYYPMLLIAQSLSNFLLLFNQGHFTDAPEIVVQTKAPIALFQILIRILQGQKQDGSRGSCSLTGKTGHRGRNLPLDRQGQLPYSSCVLLLCLLHCVTATPVPNSVSKFGELDRLILIPTKKGAGISAFLQQDAFVPGLQRLVASGVHRGRAVFGREGMGKEPYTEYIPFSWTSANSMTKNYSCPQNSFVLMTIGLINFQVDECFDSMVQDHGSAFQATVTMANTRPNIRCPRPRSRCCGFRHWDGSPLGYLHKYILFIDNYPTLQNASQYDKHMSKRRCGVFPIMNAGAALADLRKAAKEAMGDTKGNKCVDSFELFFRGAEVYNAIYHISAWNSC
ncbi:hypothetical protein K438DRAFT_1931249 [Mycena galopus ATCC 62051]|nr:hypothetical protein K438DRAFT_1931249 [Mycena galopus ATCC 62051]